MTQNEIQLKFQLKKLSALVDEANLHGIKIELPEQHARVKETVAANKKFIKEVEKILAGTTKPAVIKPTVVKKKKAWEIKMERDQKRLIAKMWHESCGRYYHCYSDLD